MNYFREAEQVLLSRKRLEDSLYQQRVSLERVLRRNAPKELSVASYDKDFTSVTAVNSVLDELLAVGELSGQIKDTEETIAGIDAALASLDKQQRDILTWWYIEGVKLDDIAERLNYSPQSKSTLYRLRNGAVYQFALQYFGARALKCSTPLLPDVSDTKRKD